MTPTLRWFQTWWLRVPSPREVSAAYSMAYLVTLFMGIVTLTFPPRTLSYELGGPQAMMSVGVLLIIGAVVGMTGGTLEHWKLERVGLWFMSGALSIYGAVVLALHLTQEGSRLTQLGPILLGLILFFLRWVMIRRFSYRPRG